MFGRDIFGLRLAEQIRSYFPQNPTKESFMINICLAMSRTIITHCDHILELLKQSLTTQDQTCIQQFRNNDNIMNFFAQQSFIIRYSGCIECLANMF